MAIQLLLLILISNPASTGLENTVTIQLELEEPLNTIGLAGRNYRVCPDGTFLLLNQTQAFHFDAKGKLIRKIGKKGQGPGEFAYLATGLWDGSRYAFYSAGNKIVTFDKEGRFESEIKTDGHLIKLGWTGHSFYGYHTGGPTVLQDPHRGIVISESLQGIFKLNDQKHFHDTSEGVRKFNFNNDNHWASQVGDLYFVADEMTPEVWIYDKNFKLIRTVSLRLPDWVNSPKEWYDRNGATREYRLKWYYSWSRLVGFYAREDAMFVAYEIPNEDEPTTTHVVIATLNHQGKMKSKPRKRTHQFMEANKNHFYILKELDKDDDPFPSYVIEVETW